MKTLLASRAALAALLLWVTPSTSSAAETTRARPVIEITGQVQQSRELTWAELEKLPQTSVSVSFVTAHGTESATYTGALLLTVLTGTPFADGPQKNAKLQHTILVTGRDGYAVAVSVGEIDPDFEGKAIILATARNGKQLDDADGIRLVVPNDRHGGRAVRDVVSLRIE